MSKDAARLWEAMLALAPVITRGNLKRAPHGTAHLVRQHAEALVTEWHRSHHSRPERRRRQGGESS
jgi:hypothetical protein